jgi:hypothetical protein
MLAPGVSPGGRKVGQRKRRKTKGRPPAMIVVRDWPSIAATHAVRRIASTGASPKRSPCVQAFRNCSESVHYEHAELGTKWLLTIYILPVCRIGKNAPFRELNRVNLFHICAKLTSVSELRIGILMTTVDGYLGGFRCSVSMLEFRNFWTESPRRSPESCRFGKITGSLATLKRTLLRK